MQIMTVKSVYKQTMILEMMKNLFEQALTDVKLEKQEKSLKMLKLIIQNPNYSINLNHIIIILYIF